jgi:anti-sigma regulatory factor (Ser/Thr protein kinase)
LVREWGAVIRVTVQLDPIGEAAREARRIVESVLADWGDYAEAVQVAVLLTSEVVTNAVVHGSPRAADGRVGLTVDGDGELARVEVTDGYRGQPVARDPRLGRASGRGIMLLDLLAARWGVTPDGDGKTVWFEIARR